ncbi:hypothetical protein [Anthocerotibacter panamensis]|uniref:hypothetical protein n=1 Tax=Anthocerotibacter panamensis TaxID=2857077 RepID=UPI001C404D6B|nr:hypothetical protein [Anthocerotibacter panamensis]
MATPDISRRLTDSILRQDINSYNGFISIPDYKPLRSEATPEILEKNYTTMLALQKDETIKLAAAKAAIDAARLAEWEFHNSILAMKEAIKGQFGSDSDQAQTIGFKKKSERKRPTTRKPAS